MENFVQIADIFILNHIPEILAWLVGIVLAVIMLRRGGGKAEKLLLAGCSLMFAVKLATPLLSNYVRSLVSEQGVSNIAIAQTMGLTVSLPMAILSLAGLVCLIIAFWIRFRSGRQVAA